MHHGRLVELAKAALHNGINHAYILSASNDHVLRLGLFTLDNRLGLQQVQRLDPNKITAIYTHNRFSNDNLMLEHFEHQTHNNHHIFDYLDAWHRGGSAAEVP